MTPPVLRDASSNSATDTPQATTQSVVSSYINVPLKHDVKNDIRALGALYGIEPSDWVLKALKASLKRYNAELKAHPAATFTGLHQLLAVDRAFEDADATKAIADIKGLWRDLDTYAITKEEIKDVAQGLRDKSVVVEYELLRPFVVEAVRQLRSKNHSPLSLEKFHDVGKLMEHSMDRVRLMCGPTSVPLAPKPKEYSHEWNSLLKTMIKYLEEIIAYGKDYNEAIKHILDARGTVMTLPQVFETFAHAVEIDTACLQEIYHHALKAVLGKDVEVIKRMEEQAKHWKTLDKALDDGRVAREKTVG